MKHDYTSIMPQGSFATGGMAPMACYTDSPLRWKLQYDDRMSLFSGCIDAPESIAAGGHYSTHIGGLPYSGGLCVGRGI